MHTIIIQRCIIYVFSMYVDTQVFLNLKSELKVVGKKIKWKWSENLYWLKWSESEVKMKWSESEVKVKWKWSETLK